jgi:hypothetical protein
LTLGLALFLPNSFEATTVERLTLNDLVKKAHMIVAGRVSSSRTFWSADRRMILTNYVVQVGETIKGRPGRTVELTTIGGSVGDVTLHVAGMPAFAVGENTVVFVENSGTFSTVVGLSQGKFAVENGEVANTVSGLEFPDGGEARPVRMKLQSFKNQIRTILASQP